MIQITPLIVRQGPSLPTELFADATLLATTEIASQVSIDNLKFHFEFRRGALWIFSLQDLYSLTAEGYTYMQKTCDVAEKAILAKKNCGKSA